ncbi:MAG TPA: glutamate--tRNA ligase family protein [Puia sp.]|jgi:glutamyl-tRNA synthetase
MNTPKTFSKTRIAPTPSGYLHLGNILSFSITATLARQTGAKILLRIDDLDRERAERKYIDDIFDTLHFLKIDWDEGPRDTEDFEKEYSQLHRMDHYHRALRRLQDNGEVYACTCSRTQILKDSPDGSYPGTCRDKNIPLDTENACWRLHTPLSADLPKQIQDFIVRKKDGFPAYQLTSVIDDLHYGIDLVVRGEDLRDSTLAQQYLATVLKEDRFARIAFYHHPLLLDATGKKLSKTDGDISIQYLRRQGITPEGIRSRIEGMK